MSIIAEELLEELGDRGGYVVLVGDGKTYQHLMSVKRLYGSAFERLLIFPGDWHTLTNLQPVLMKIYYKAGLQDLAKSSGYRGTTLKSLELCSNFKRTHEFLLQVWEVLYREMMRAFLHNHDNKTVLKFLLTTAVEQKYGPEESMHRIEDLLQDTETYTAFKEFIEKWKKQMTHGDFGQALCFVTATAILDCT
jgi:hypothetical protein